MCKVYGRTSEEFDLSGGRPHQSSPVRHNDLVARLDAVHGISSTREDTIMKLSVINYQVRVSHCLLRRFAS